MTLFFSTIVRYTWNQSIKSFFTAGCNKIHFEIQCLPLNIITLDQQKSDNNNPMIQLTIAFFVLYCGIMGPVISDHHKRLIL